jgi:hypothetical protein
MTQSLPLNELTDILAQWVGRKVLVTKEENGDVDQTLIDLERLDQEVYDNNHDDYLSNATLQLVGNGQTVNQGEKAPLPYAAFDIPVDEAEELHCDVEAVFLRTARAVYTFTPV